MRLGEMLVRDGRLTREQVEQALAHQSKVGGRLGTVLVELKLLDPDTLTVYLGLELGIPVATRAAMERAKKAAVKLIPAELAARVLAIPLVMQDRALIVAMRDPHDLVLLDELAAATGYRIVPRIASETRLYYYLERYYGVPRPERFATMGDDWSVHARADADGIEPPPPPLPGLPPPVDHPVVAPAATATVSTLASVQALSAGEESDYDELALELEEDASEPATLVPPGMVGETTASPGSAPSPQPEESEDPAVLSYDEAIEKMSEASSRGQVANALIGYARGVVDVAALLVVREQLALGWRGFGKDIDRDRIETLLIPLETPSIFRGAVEHDVQYAGPAAPSALHQHLFKVLRTGSPSQAIVSPIYIGKRVVNLFYGHREGDRWLDDAELEAVRRVTRTAADAYVRLIALHKKSG
jgi:hypothetical protein